MARGSVSGSSSVMLVLLLGVVCTAPAVVRGGGQEWVVGDNMGWSSGVASWVESRASTLAMYWGELLIYMIMTSKL